MWLVIYVVELLQVFVELIFFLQSFLYTPTGDQEASKKKRKTHFRKTIEISDISVQKTNCCGTRKIKELIIPVY